MPLVRHPNPTRVVTPTPEATSAEAAGDAFSSWLTGVLTGRGSSKGATLEEGARLFAGATGESTFRQAKVALAQVAAHLEEHCADDPGLKDAFFVAVQPVLLEKARAEGDKGASTRSRAASSRSRSSFRPRSLRR